MPIAMPFADAFCRLLRLLRLFAVLALLQAASAYAASCAPATTQGTAPAAWQTYCWLDFSAYDDAAAQTSGGQNFSFTLNDGTILSLNLHVSTTISPAMTAIVAPSWTGAAVGNTAFLGIPGKPVLYTATSGTKTVTIRNIAVTPPPGSPAITAYSVVIADAESTDSAESIQTVTNGSNWILLDDVPPISGSQYPGLSGIGTNTVTMSGNGLSGNVGGYIVGTHSPTQVSTTLVAGGLQGIMVGVRFASVRLTKQIVGTRVDPADQFTFSLTATGSGATLATGTTSGSALGPFNTVGASVASSLQLTLSESMAAGSANTLAHYQSRLTCTNSTAGSPTVLPVNVATTSYNLGALTFGDDLRCTFTNTPYPHIRVKKALSSAGRVFTADQFTVSLRQGNAVIASSTTTGTGATVTAGDTTLVQVAASTSYNLSEAATGTTNLSFYDTSLSCTNANATSSTALPTTAPGALTPVLGDVITCIITNAAHSPTAVLLIDKTSALLSDPVNGTANPKAVPGAIIEYRISVSNIGPAAVDANSIVITDALPDGVTFDATTSVQLTNGSTASGLNPFDAATMVTYSNNSGGTAPYTYAPAGGFDANIHGLRIAPTGTMAASDGAAHPGFTIIYQVRVK